MAYFIINKKIFSLKLSAEEFSTWAVLESHDFYDIDNGNHRKFICWPSMDTIVDEVKIDKKKLIEIIQFLQDIGLIAVRERKRTRGKPMNEYLLKDIENTGELELDAIRARIPGARNEMRERLKDKRQKKREKRGEVNPFTIVEQYHRIIEEQSNHNIGVQIGFNIGVQSDHNTGDGIPDNTVPRSPLKINPLTINHLTNKQGKGRKDYKIIDELNHYGHKYKFRDDAIVWDEYSRREWGMDEVRAKFPDDHPVRIKAQKLYEV
jgi:hypothetical protein